MEESDLLRKVKHERLDRDARIALNEETRDERKYISGKKKFKEGGGHSSTNTDKSKNKNWTMTKNLKKNHKKSRQSIVSKQRLDRKQFGYGRKMNS